jgi:hypothetical protein
MKSQRAVFFWCLMILTLSVTEPAQGGPLSQTISIPTIQAGQSFTYTFDQASGPFASDFDEANAGVLTTAQYTFNGITSTGHVILAQWSPQVNDSGQFVGFLGNDANGNPSDAPVAPVQVATLVGDDGVTYGNVLASSNEVITGSTETENTQFTFNNTSGVDIDPTVNGAQISGVVQENFGANGIFFPSKSTTVSIGSTSTSTTGYTLTNIQSMIGTAANLSPVTSSFLSTRTFTAINSSSPVSATLSSGAITVSDSNPSGGGSGSLAVQVFVAALSSPNTPIVSLTFPTINFSGVGTFSFSGGTSNGTVPLTPYQQYQLDMSWNLSWTPFDTTASVVADPTIDGNVGTVVPEPSSLILLVLTLPGLFVYSGRRFPARTRDRQIAR